MCKKSLFQHVARTFCGQKLFMFPLYIDIVLYKTVLCNLFPERTDNFVIQLKRINNYVQTINF